MLRNCEVNNRSFTSSLIIFLLVLCSCSGGKKENQNTDSNANPLVEELDETPDSAMLVKLLDIEGETMVVQPDNDIENPIEYSFTDAQQNGQIKGSLTIGDTLSIFPDNKSNSIKISINVSELRGRWFYDMKQHRGLQFEPRGAVSSINPENISFREWKLLNGKLYIYYVDAQQVSDNRQEFLVEQAEITSLSKEELVIRFLNTTFDCKRQHGVIMLGH